MKHFKVSFSSKGQRLLSHQKSEKLSKELQRVAKQLTSFLRYHKKCFTFILFYFILGGEEKISF